MVFHDRHRDFSGLRIHLHSGWPPHNGNIACCHQRITNSHFVLQRSLPIKKDPHECGPVGGEELAGKWGGVKLPAVGLWGCPEKCR